MMRLKKRQIISGLDFAEHFDAASKVFASQKYNDQIFCFNLKRLTFAQLQTLFHEIDGNDNYCLKMAPRRGAVIVDIGMHIGVFPFVANQKLKNATIYCVEPDRDNMALAKSNLRLVTKKSSNNFLFYEIALGIKEGRTKFYVSDKIDWRSTILQKKSFLKNPLISKTEFTSTYDVPCLKLETFLRKIPQKKIHIFKMTVAGELEADLLEQSLPAFREKQIETFALLVYPRNLERVTKFFHGLRYREHSCPRKGVLRVFRRS